MSQFTGTLALELRERSLPGLGQKCQVICLPFFLLLALHNRHSIVPLEFHLGIDLPEGALPLLLDLVSAAGSKVCKLPIMGEVP